MIRQLPNYYEHLDKNRSSYIARIYGIFEVSIDKFSTLHVMIMANTLHDIAHSSLEYVFDLKGSTVNREVLKNKSSADIKIDGPTQG